MQQGIAFVLAPLPTASLWLVVELGLGPREVGSAAAWPALPCQIAQEGTEMHSFEEGLWIPVQTF